MDWLLSLKYLFVLYCVVHPSNMSEAEKTSVKGNTCMFAPLSLSLGHFTGTTANQKKGWRMWKKEKARILTFTLTFSPSTFFHLSQNIYISDQKRERKKVLGLCTTFERHFGTGVTK